MTANTCFAGRTARTAGCLAFVCASLLALACLAPRPALAVDICSDDLEAALGLASAGEESLVATAEVGNAQSTVRRLSGATRYDTMSSIVSAGFSQASTVVIASGENFPDSLSAAALAGSLDAPVLLTAGGALSEQTAAQIKMLGASKAIVLGGTAAISDDVTDELAALGLSVRRVAGATRQDTAAAVAREVASSSIVSTAVVAAAPPRGIRCRLAPTATRTHAPLF